MSEIRFIPNDIVERLRDLDCEEVAEALGIDVRRHMAHCFHHSDYTPSLGFKRNYWKCFSCGRGGNAISLVMDRMSVPFVKACVILCGLYGIPLSNNIELNHRKVAKYVRNLHRLNYTGKSEHIHFDREIAEYIISITELTESGKDFLYTERKLQPRVVEKSHIRSIEYKAPFIQKLINRFGTKRLISSKVLNNTGRHLVFPTPALLIPYYDEDNVLIGLQTRYLKEISPDQKISKFNRICNSSIRLYNLSILDSLSPNERLVVAEGITDCLALQSDGIKAIALPSATSMPIEDLYKLRIYNLQMIPDQDSAGMTAFTNLHSTMLRFGCEMKKINLPLGYKDYCAYRINDFQKKD